MDTNGSPLLGRSKNSHNFPPDSLHAGPFSITRNFKADVHSGHPLRSPFSKLMSSNYNSQNPAKSISTQSYQCSENMSRSSLPLAARPLTIRTSGNEYTPSKGPILHQDIKTNQKAHSVQSPAPASLRQKLDGGDHVSYSKHSEESNDSEEHRDLNYTSTKLSQDLRQSFKEEYDVSPSPFRSMQSEIRGKTGTISAPENNSGYITGPPHRYGYSVDGLSDPSGRRSSTGLHICAGDNSIVDSRSRSSSVALSLKEQPADDLSALMFKGATDLRNAKLALEEQTKEMQKLKDELITVTAERNGLVQRVVLVKQKAKDGLESNAKKLSDMETLLQALESKSRECFTFVEVSRTSMADVENLKEIVKNSAKCLETLVGEDGVYAPTQGWKAVLSEVQFDVSNKQQVIDMFRDRLEYTQGELADAKNRIAELEMLQSQDNNVLRLSSKKLVDAGSKLAELAALLKSQQQESVDTLIKNSALGAKLDVYEDEYVCDASSTDKINRDISAQYCCPQADPF
ncbi:hypothetical protein DFH11DRAFT_328565 [Phellopilus nigrolimitatus]|nr:hypothetical protein DFH11DRAFT_328565 [Phellopilus nigrolimitatus]